MNIWHIVVNGQTMGPYSAEEISTHLASGRIGTDILVWKEGMADWTSISQIAELNPGTQQSPMGPPLPTPGTARGMTAHEIDYKIFGQEMQFVEIELDPGESAVAEAGAMMYMTDGIAMETIFGDGSTSSQTGGFFDKLIGAGKRLITGESLFCTVFTQQGHGKAKVAFGAPYPGKIIPLELKDYDNQIVCQKDAFLCAAKGVSIGLAFQKKIGTALFGGEGFIMQKTGR